MHHELQHVRPRVVPDRVEAPPCGGDLVQIECGGHHPSVAGERPFENLSAGGDNRRVARREQVLIPSVELIGSGQVARHVAPPEERGDPDDEDPALLGTKVERLVAGSSLRRVDGESGYPVSYGTSFMMALDFTTSGPKAKAFLTYSNTEDRTSKDYVEATERFSPKTWGDVAFTEADVAKATTSTKTVKG